MTNLKFLKTIVKRKLWKFENLTRNVYKHIYIYIIYIYIHIIYIIYIYIYIYIYNILLSYFFEKWNFYIIKTLHLSTTKQKIKRNTSKPCGWHLAFLNPSMNISYTNNFAKLPTPPIRILFIKNLNTTEIKWRYCTFVPP